MEQVNTCTLMCWSAGEENSLRVKDTGAVSSLAYTYVQNCQRNSEGGVAP